MKIHFILYVQDQEQSTTFYSQLLEQAPILHVPGMTEFQLSAQTILGLMPVKGIANLLASAKPQFDTKNNFLKAEVYLYVDNPAGSILKAQKLGAKLLDNTKSRTWGHEVAYCQDLDGYVIAFAKELTSQKC